MTASASEVGMRSSSIPSASRTSTRATLGGREGVPARREADTGAARSFGSGERSTSTALARTSSPLFVRTAVMAPRSARSPSTSSSRPGSTCPSRSIARGDAPSASASTSDRAGSGVEKSSADSDAASSSTCSTFIVRAPVVTTRAARATAIGRASCAVSEPLRSRSSAAMTLALDASVKRPAPTPSIAARTRSPRSNTPSLDVLVMRLGAPSRISTS